MKPRLVLPALAATAALAVAGCGGSSDASSGGSPAALAPPQAPVFIEVAVRPEGELKSNVEALAESIGGIDDLGDLVVSELEQSASDSDEELDYAKEVEPWLGEKAGIFLDEYDGEDFTEYGIAVQTSDADATQAFVDKQSKSDEGPADDGSYEGVDYKVERDDGMTVGVIDDFLAFAEDEQAFKAMVDASAGESLAEEASFSDTFDAASNGSFADVFVDVGELIDQSGGTIDPEAQQFLDSAGIDAKEATAVASLVPGSDQIEIEVSTDLGAEKPPTGDASELLGSLPADSFAAFALADFGDRFEEAIDEIDANGIPGEIPKGQFKSGLKEAGIDIEKIAASVGDLGVFAEGSSESSLAGAAVLATKSAKEATNTVSNIGLLLRASGIPGITAISGKASGFSIRSADLGPKPLVIAAQGERIAVAYGLPAATRALAAASGQRLADSPLYEEAVAALGSTPISGFVDGPAALRLASALIAGSDDADDFREAKPYLAKIEYLAIGSGAEDGLASVRLMAGVGE
ncbi:MAG: DUF3352 domain-containing protein [Solirubrobacterales bacterium]